MVPVGVAVAGLAKLSVAPFKVHFDVHVIDDFQRFAHWVIAERRHVEQNHVQASDLGTLGDIHVVVGEVGILAKDAHVLAEGRGSGLSVHLQLCHGQQVDAVKHPRSLLVHFDAGLRALWHGDVIVLEREVGQALCGGPEAAFQRDFLSPIGSVFNVGNADFRDGVMQREACWRAAFDADPLRCIGAETIGLLGIGDVDGQYECEKGKKSFHSDKSMFQMANLQIFKNMSSVLTHFFSMLLQFVI